MRTTLRDVQAQLLFQVAARDILVGHSLESDLRAVKLLHSRVVDTAIVFPHKMGPPYKRALRTLAVEQIQRIIQNDGGSSLHRGLLFPRNFAALLMVHFLSVHLYLKEFYITYRSYSG